MLLSLLVSVFMLGFKLSALKGFVQIVQRRSELQRNLALLRSALEAEQLNKWLSDVAYDEERRTTRVVAIESVHQVYDEAESSLLEQGSAMFTRFDSSPGKVTDLKSSSPYTCVRSETKYDPASRLLLGRTVLNIRGATPLAIVSYLLDFDGRHVQSKRSPANDVRSETVATVNGHHTIVFFRKKQFGVTDRTFLNSIVAKKVCERPQTYLVAIMPIRSHVSISEKDEAHAVRAENCRVFRVTESAPDVTMMDYTCSLDLKGRVPHRLTNAVCTPGQVGDTLSWPDVEPRLMPANLCGDLCGRCTSPMRCSCTSSSSGPSFHVLRRTVRSLRTCS